MKYYLYSYDINWGDYLWGEFSTFADAYEALTKLETEVDGLVIETK